MTLFVGLLAVALGIVAWVPQLWRTWRTRSAGDLSWGYLATTAAGFSTWLTYGVLTRDPAIVVANVASLLLVCTLTTLKARAAVHVGPVIEPAA